MNKLPALLAFGLASLPLAGMPDWKPEFEDKPVAPKLLKMVEQAMPDKPHVSPKADRKILVFSSTSGFRHGSIPIGLYAMEQLGDQSGAFDVVVSNEFSNFEPDALEEFDAVVLLNTTGPIFLPNWKTQKDDFTKEEWQQMIKRHKRLIGNLIDYVEAGGGLVGIHAATDACYGEREYGEAMGGYFAGHPWNGNNEVTIVVEDPEHAVNEHAFGDVEDFRIKEEIYQFQDEPYSRERLRILLHLDPERSDKVDPKRMKREDGDYAVSWVQKVGDGRVFYTSLGHNFHIYWDPMILRHYLAGIQFATGDLEADTTPSATIAIPLEQE
ncbi:MAG: ThuA domain-containing protein [Verrucomicrobiota bacterium]